jgi:hypothetical protein
MTKTVPDKRAAKAGIHGGAIVLNFRKPLVGRCGHPHTVI